jgi:hypothetical protein
METKKKEPYIPITERARTGLYRVSDCWWLSGPVLSYNPMWYLTPGRAMSTTTMAARNDPMHAETKDCCHVYML